MAYETCPKCRGVKKARLLGWVLKECDRCGGIGKVKVEPEPIETPISDEAIQEAVTNVIESAKKKRSKDGREQEETEQKTA